MPSTQVSYTPSPVRPSHVPALLALNASANAMPCRVLLYAPSEKGTYPQEQITKETPPHPTQP